MTGWIASGVVGERVTGRNPRLERSDRSRGAVGRHRGSADRARRAACRPRTRRRPAGPLCLLLLANLYREGEQTASARRSVSGSCLTGVCIVLANSRRIWSVSVAKGEAKLRAMVVERDRTLRAARDQIVAMKRAMAELESSQRVCARCVHRMCSECGASLVGRYASAVTCSGACRQRRQHRLRAAAADITSDMRLWGGITDITGDDANRA